MDLVCLVCYHFEFRNALFLLQEECPTVSKEALYD